MTNIDVFGPYRFGTRLGLDQEAKQRLFRLFETPPAPGKGVLSGRTGPILSKIQNVGPVVVKHYRRGGLVRHFIRDRYLRLGRTRPRREYDMLETVRRLGVRSPEPLLWAVRGCLFYKAFLVTRKIDGSRSLSQMATEDPAGCRMAVGKTAEQIRILIENRVHHVDLHPGNVLLDAVGEAHLIDFDKARRVSWSRKKLQEAYVNRWRRAVEKYALPAIMTDALIAGLKSSR